MAADSKPSPKVTIYASAADLALVDALALEDAERLGGGANRSRTLLALAHEERRRRDRRAEKKVETGA